MSAGLTSTALQAAQGGQGFVSNIAGSAACFAAGGGGGATSGATGGTGGACLSGQLNSTVATTAGAGTNVGFTGTIAGSGAVNSGSGGGGGDCPTAAEIAAEVLSQLQGTTIPVNLVKVRNQTIVGTGTESNPWGPA
jgi:hypothetical protein